MPARDDPTPTIGDDFMTNTTLSDTPTKPAWADWVEAPDEPHLVTGIRCRECGADVTGTNRDEPSEFGTIWELLNHDDSCEQAREYRFYELNHQDITHLHHLYNLYGRERVVRWLKGNVALPTDLELKKLNGHDVDEEAYYQSAADYYLDLDSESELESSDTTTHDGDAKNE